MSKTDFSSNIRAKKAAGQAAAEFVKEGMLVGLGTGSTATYFIEALGVRCQSGLKIKAIATSQKSMHQAQSLGIPLANSDAITSLDLTVDGADEIDPHKNMIKGGGGALLREKLLALASREMIVIVDEKKLVKELGAFPVSVEIAPFAYLSTLARLDQQGYPSVLRLNRDKSLYLTDNGHYIVDIQFTKPILDPAAEHDRLKTLGGVLETGLFFHVASLVVIGYEDGFVKIQA